VRFASVYKDFQKIGDFERELGLLLQWKGSKARPHQTTTSRWYWLASPQDVEGTKDLKAQAGCRITRL
jgi:hypothetical protein